MRGILRALFLLQIVHRLLTIRTPSTRSTPFHPSFLSGLSQEGRRWSSSTQKHLPSCLSLDNSPVDSPVQPIRNPTYAPCLVRGQVKPPPAQHTQEKGRHADQHTQFRRRQTPLAPSGTARSRNVERGGEHRSRRLKRREGHNSLPRDGIHLLEREKAIDRVPKGNQKSDKIQKYKGKTFDLIGKAIEKWLESACHKLKPLR